MIRTTVFSWASIIFSAGLALLLMTVLVKLFSKEILQFFSTERAGDQLDNEPWDSTQSSPQTFFIITLILIFCCFIVVVLPLVVLQELAGQQLFLFYKTLFLFIAVFISGLAYWNQLGGI